jgi:uncharacterized ion transporter superfamily protein YfcC
MHIVYYFFAIFAILYELGNLYAPNKIINFKKNIKGKKAEEFTTSQKTFTFLLLAYFVWGILGLFTSQWLIFLVWLLLGFIPKKWAAWVIVDAILSVAIIILIILNRFHLHYSMNELIEIVGNHFKQF